MKLDAATRTWDQLAAHVEAFLAAWEKSSFPPDPADNQNDDGLERPSYSDGLERPSHSDGLERSSYSDGLERQSHSDGAPRLGDFLPEEPPVLRRLTLVELVKVDLEQRFGRARGKLLEQYVAEFPELAEPDELPADLIYEEYHVRLQAGEAVNSDQYAERFPNQAGALSRLFGQEATLASTVLIPRGPIEVDAGDTIDDFDLLLRLGKGAFATVFLARQRSMQRMVALKVSADRGSEAQTMAQMDHPYVVRVFDQRQLPDRGLRLLYMQYVSGGTLQDVIAAAKKIDARARTGAIVIDSIDISLTGRGESSPETPGRRNLAAAGWAEVVCRIGIQLALGLDHAHRHGVLHRDVKPANVLLAADGTAKLADFNVSFGSELEGSTAAAFFGGSLAYMSPEQLQACNPAHLRQPDDLDGRSDLYSLGVLLWELLHGTRPFVDEEVETNWATTLSDMTARRMEGVPESADRTHDATQVQLERVLRRVMAPQRDDRHADGAALATELRLCLLPRSLELMRAPEGGWRRLVLRYPVAAVLMAALVPNALAGMFNYYYNHRAIIDPIAEESPELIAVFESTVLAINSVAFPLGIVISILIVRPIAVALRRPNDRSSPAVVDGRIARRALRLAHYAAIVGILEWGIAGLTYPLVLHMLVPALPLSTYWKFMLSLAISGLIAAAYPFFLVLRYSLRVLYPALLQQWPALEVDRRGLAATSRIAGVYLLMAGTVPMLGVLALVFISQQQQTVQLALGIVVAAGLYGFFRAWLMYRSSQHDINALIAVGAPPDSPMPEQAA